MNDDTDELRVWLIGGVVALLVIVALTTLLGGWAAITGRMFGVYNEETRKQIYDSSRQYQQGTNRDLSRYCYQMRTASSPAAKSAVADLIRSTASTYNGSLSPENQSCLNEVQ
jgi:hypothetical protein